MNRLKTRTLNKKKSRFESEDEDEIKMDSDVVVVVGKKRSNQFSDATLKPVNILILDDDNEDDDDDVYPPSKKKKKTTATKTKKKKSTFITTSPIVDVTSEKNSRTVVPATSSSDVTSTHFLLSSKKNQDEVTKTTTMTTAATTMIPTTMTASPFPSLPSPPLLSASLPVIDSSISTAPVVTTLTLSSSVMITDANVTWRKMVRDFVHHRLSRNQLDFLSEVGATDMFGSPSRCVEVSDDLVSQVFSMEQSKTLFELKIIASVR